MEPTQTLPSNGVLLQIRGFSGRSGLFLTGRPEQLLLFNDGLVLVKSRAALAATGVFGAVGGVIQAIQQQSESSRLGAQSQAASFGSEFAAATKRSTYIPLTNILSAVLKSGYPGRRLEITTTDDQHFLHKYALFPGAKDDVVIPALSGVLGNKFISSVQ